MNDAPEPVTFDDVSGLLTYLEADTLEDAGHVISEQTDPDAWFEMDEGQLVVGIETTAFVLEFPLSSVDFWEMIHELEDDAGARLDNEVE